MYIFYKIYLQWIYWTLYFIARCSTIFASELPEEITLRQYSVGFDRFVMTLYEHKSEWLDQFVWRQWFQKWLKSLQVAKWEINAGVW